MKKVPTVPSFAMKALEVVSTLKQKIVCNLKELKLLLTILLTIVAILDKKLRKLILVQLHFFPFREKKYKVMLRLVVTFQRFHIYRV